MLDVSGEDKKIKLKLDGFITNYQYSRYSRNQIYLFVNNRWVKNQKLSRALLRGYANVLQSGKFPAAFLFMTIDKEQVDINIHPRKEEVQFLHPRTVEQLITRCAKEKLEAQIKVNVQDSQKGFTFAPATKSSDTFPMESTGPSLNLANEKFEEFYEEPGIEFEIEFDPEGGLEEPKISINSEQNKPEPQEKKKLGSMFDISNFPQQQRNLNEISIEKKSQLEDIIQQSFHKLQYTFVGQLFKTYLMIERDEQLIMIDQHAAHERVLYELFSKKFEDIATVNLMFPQTIHLSENEFKLIGPYLGLLREHGIGIEEFGEAELVVSCTPVNIKNVDLQKFVQQVIGWIEEHDEVDEVLFKKQLNEHIHSHMACKAAVKAGDILEEEQIHQLIRDLEKSDNRLTCPHGRPTMWVVTQSEIEKNFKRKV
jgi:DNA mismatch repair protein MutL